ncbi:hypothetical protein [Haliea salexigens]|uniref:hypothetical protein n=1 Tax=Haliea salexigens TaxID=287487 RepID=UPI0003F95C96|nr:hypothetical protein [Haliea salexigens]
MATAFPFSSYALLDTSGAMDDHIVSREVMDDGTPVIRVLGTSTFRTLTCEFVPMSISDAQALMDYLHTNKATEFDMSGDGLGTSIYRGYIWSEPRIQFSQGVLATVSFNFYGKRISG